MFYNKKSSQERAGAEWTVDRELLFQQSKTVKERNIQSMIISLSRYIKLAEKAYQNRYKMLNRENAALDDALKTNRELAMNEIIKNFTNLIESEKKEISAEISKQEGYQAETLQDDKLNLEEVEDKMHSFTENQYRQPENLHKAQKEMSTEIQENQYIEDEIGGVDFIGYKAELTMYRGWYEKYSLLRELHNELADKYSALEISFSHSRADISECDWQAEKITIRVMKNSSEMELLNDLLFEMQNLKNSDYFADIPDDLESGSNTSGNINSYSIEKALAIEWVEWRNLFEHESKIWTYNRNHPDKKIEGLWQQKFIDGGWHNFRAYLMDNILTHTATLYYKGKLDIMTESLRALDNVADKKALTITAAQGSRFQTNSPRPENPFIKLVNENNKRYNFFLNSY